MKAQGRRSLGSPPGTVVPGLSRPWAFYQCVTCQRSQSITVTAMRKIASAA